MKRAICFLVLTALLFVFAAADAKEPVSLGFDGNRLNQTSDDCGCGQEANEISMNPIMNHEDSRAFDGPPAAPDRYTGLYVPNCWNVSGGSQISWIIQFLECREATRGDPYWD